MNLLSLFQSTTNPERARKEAARQHRYEYGIREVERWTQAKKVIAADGADLTRRFQEKIAELSQRQGPHGEGVKVLQWNMERYQERTEELLQEADYRLAIYRNIVLMQGRIWPD